MAIAPFDEHGFLPAAVHDCTLDEIKGRFGSFQLSDRRPALFEKLLEFIAEVKSATIAHFLLIDGSFATGKPDPNDIDLVLVLPVEHDLTGDLSVAEYNVLSKRRVQRRYGFDIVAVRSETVEYDEAVAFFMQVRHILALRKGILRSRL